MISIVLMEPEKPGNIGAVARAMHNFGYSRLVLVNPKCDNMSQESRNRAKHAQQILKKARIAEKGELKKFEYLIGTTARLGTDYNIPRSPLTPRQLVKVLPKRGNIALLFGNEGTGLSNKQIRECDFIVHIPTGTKNPTLNLSHAVTIILYELKIASAEKKLAFKPAPAHEKEILLKEIGNVLDRMEFKTKEKKETQRTVWKRLIGKGFLTRRELFALFGFFKKMK
jgi:tRNA/rRNA methyltransferase